MTVPGEGRLHLHTRQVVLGEMRPHRGIVRRQPGHGVPGVDWGEKSLDWVTLLIPSPSAGTGEIEPAGLEGLA